MTLPLTHTMAGMSDGNVLGVAALAISLFALAISAAFAARQVALMRHANYVPILIDLLGQFRSLEFNNNYRYVCTRLAHDYDSAAGISGLPDDVRAKVYDVAYYYQLFAALAALRVVRDEHIVAVFRDRIINVWQEIEPFVHAERDISPSTGSFLLRQLEEFAKKAQQMPSSAVDRFMRGNPPRSLKPPSYPWTTRG
jgi:hypothetical protein